MGHTNSTVNYNLPQFVGTDKPSWLSDVNGAFLAIDTAIAAAKTTADSAAGGVASLQNTVGSHTTQIGTLTDTVTAQGGTLNSVTALIGNGTPTTTDQTIIGAINEINAEVNPGSVSVTADGVKTYAELLNTLHDLITRSKLSKSSVLKIIDSSDNYVAAKLAMNYSSFYKFVWTEVNGTTNASLYDVSIKPSGTGSTYTLATLSAGGNSLQDRGATIPTDGIKLEIEY